MGHLLRCRRILWHPTLDSDQLTYREINNGNSEFSADVIVPPLSIRPTIPWVSQNCAATNQTQRAQSMAKTMPQSTASVWKMRCSHTGAEADDVAEPAASTASNGGQCRVGRRRASRVGSKRPLREQGGLRTETDGLNCYSEPAKFSEHFSISHRISATKCQNPNLVNNFSTSHSFSNPNGQNHHNMFSATQMAGSITDISPIPKFVAKTTVHEVLSHPIAQE